MLLTLLLYLSILFPDPSQPVELYLPSGILSSEWAGYVFETHVVSDRSMIVCSSMCQSKTTCNCFVLVGDQCHLGSPDQQLTVLPDPVVQVMVYVDLGAICILK